jgi:trimeric autotransporter adhesin
MELKRIHKYLKFFTMACMAVSLSTASEHRGIVKFGGLPVPGATVTAVQGEKKFVAVTDQQGAYSFADLPDGVWNLQVEMLCFTTLKQEVAIAPNAPSPEWELKMLPFDEIKASSPVSAPASAPAGAPASASTPAAASAANGNGTPSLVASVKAAETATKGKKGAKNATVGPTNAKSGFQRTDVNASAGAAPPDPAPAAGGVDEAAPAAGDALMVNGSVSNGIERRAIGNARKGPGSAYRGDFSTVVDNSFLNARNFSITGQDTPKAAYNHLRFGVTVGGPLSIPHLFHSNNGNFFVAYQMVRNRNANNQSTLMPTAPSRTGDLSGLLNAQGIPATVIDPTNGLPFPGNVIPQSRISPQAAALLNFYPLPNFDPTARYNYQLALIGVTSSDAMQSRLNKMVNPRNFLNGTFAFQRTNTESPNIFAFRDTNHNLGINTNAGWRHTFTKMVSGNLTLNFSRLSAKNTPYFANVTNVAGAAGIAGNNQDPVNWGPPSLNFGSGFASLGDSQYSSTRNQQSAVSYNILWMKRPHNFQFGGDLRRNESNVFSQQDPRGSFGFTGAATQMKVNGVAVPGTGSDFADFLLGIPDTSSIAFGNADKYFRSTNYDLYFNDDWRVNAGLTINGGVRWDYGSPITELYGRLVNLDVIPGFSAETPVLASNPTGALTGQRYPSSLVHPDKHGIQPRIGISLRPIFGSSLVIRAGYGVNYNTSVYNAIANQMAQQSPLSKSLSVLNTPANPLTLANGFNATPGITPNTFAVDPNFRIGYAQNWQASVQQDLPAAMIVTATYLGVKGTRAVQAFYPNTYPTGALDPCPSCPSGYAYMTSNGNSTREAGQIQLRRRMHNGMTASVLYVYSKSFDDAVLGGRGQGGSMIAQDWLHLNAERGPSNFDQRHQVTIQTQYSTGMGVHGGALLRGWKGAAFKGWTVVSSITTGSGLPETPVYIQAIQGTGSTQVRPDPTGIALYTAPAGRFLNPAAYTAPAYGHWGSAGRNSIVGPAVFSMNASMARTFHENLDLRLDATNALNHVTFSSWNAVASSSQFGLPSAANNMRSVQATLRWRW